MTMKQLVKNLGDQFNLPVTSVQNLDLDSFVDNAIKASNSFFCRNIIELFPVGDFFSKHVLILILHNSATSPLFVCSLILCVSDFRFYFLNGNSDFLKVDRLYRWSLFFEFSITKLYDQECMHI